MSKRAGFTLVEIMIVVAVIGLIASIALLNFIRARQTAQGTLCSQYLERLDGAKAQAAFEHNLGDNDTPTDAQLADFLNKPIGFVINGSTDLCPGGGAYAVNIMANPPSCSLAGGPGTHQVN